MEFIVCHFVCFFLYFRSSFSAPAAQNFGFDIVPGISSLPGSAVVFSNPLMVPKFVISIEDDRGFIDPITYVAHTIRMPKTDKNEMALDTKKSENNSITFGQPSPPEQPISPDPPKIINTDKPVLKDAAAIHFEDTPADHPNCSYKHGLTVYKSNCARLLSSASCGPGYWLILTEQEFAVPYCTRKPCKDEQIPYMDKCVNAFEQNVCKEREILYLDYHGQSHCDCEPKLIYDEASQKCLHQHEQGSCPDEYYLEINDIGNVICVHNPCKKPHLVLNTKNGLCYIKNFTGSCKGVDYLLDFNPKIPFVNCRETSNRNIFEVPALSSCPPGTKRTHLQVCQAVHRVEGRSANSYRVPTRYSTYSRTCPFGYRRFPDNSCRKRNPLLG